MSYSWTVCSALQTARAVEEANGGLIDVSVREATAAAEAARLKLRRFLERQSAYDVEVLLSMVGYNQLSSPRLRSVDGSSCLLLQGLQLALFSILF